MDFVDYYKILGIDKKATADEVKAAYRKLARKHHPDLNPNDKEAHKKFQQINEANEVLSDPEKRKKYDEYGKDWKHAEAFEANRQQQQARHDAGSAYTAGAGDFGDEDFSEFFESMFGSQRRSGGSQVKFRGQDYHAELELTLEEAYHTHQQTLTVNDKKIRITIPAGVENGQVIKLRGHGGPGINNGPAGDLYITFVISDHPRFKRDGNDLYTTIELDLYTALLGGDISFETIDGKTLKLKVNPETQNNTKIRLKGKGFPVYKKEGTFGDLYVTYQVKLPTGLTEKQKELVRALAKS